MGKPNTIFDFFKRKNTQSSNANVGDASSPTSDIVISENSSKKSRRVDVNEFDISSLEFDPGLRHQIWEYNLKASIDVVRVLAFQGVAFRGRDESVDSTNCGNFLEILNLMVSYNEQIAEVIAKAPKNASYTSPMIQKEILHIFSTRVKEAIRKEISNAKFCIMVDEARDESMKEQMAIVLRFVDKDGFVRERFFGLVHVANTAALTLQKGIYFVLSQHKLAIENIRGQGYDGASNMRELRISQTAEIAYLIEINEIESGRGLNQISTLQRAGDTRWSSHLRSVSSLIKIISPVCEVILKIIDVGTTSSQ
ncbi:uncharacterized protein LOC133868836 [Alnus glutinosa]|uniref:uncharacterized protein LOC133868836 n=1 Tax=Alnus glutinosa TaxID=3517 RepID=UPI002D769FF3|nr:uncharacterized protein LOC133868836 [Alnus glutinosa]